MEHFYVLNLDHNTQKVEKYDVLPYLRKCYKECRKSLKPTTVKELKTFIKNNAQYQWWSRYEYEIIVSSLHSNRIEKKLDVFNQVMMNIDVITNILAKELKIKD